MKMSKLPLLLPLVAVIGLPTMFVTACPGIDDSPATLQIADSAWVSLGGNSSIDFAATRFGGGNADIRVAVEDPGIIGVVSSSGGRIVIEGLSLGGTVMTVTNAADARQSAKVAVNVSGFFPARETDNVHIDGELVIAFDNVPVLNPGGSIRIYERGTGTMVDEILFDGERLTTLAGNDLNVGSQLVRIEGNRVHIIPRFVTRNGVLQNAMQYDSEYYVVIPPDAITARLNGNAFNGIRDIEGERDTWWFATRAAPLLNAATPVTVDRSWNSTADFRSLNGALLAVAGRGGDWTINIAPGIYNELVNYVTNQNTNITIVGQGNAPFGRDVVIQWTNNEQMNPGTHTRASFRFSGADLVLKNITLINTTERTGSGNWQAETLFFANGAPANVASRGRTVAAFNSTFLSHQDTIQTSGRAWFYKCYIAGDVDYIWGTSTVALLENSELVSVRDHARVADAIIFVSRTPTIDNTVGKGYVLLNSTVTTRDTAITWFGRNAGAFTGGFDQAAIINTNFVNEGLLSRIGVSGWRLDGGRYLFAAGNNQHVGWKIYGITFEGQQWEVPAPLADTTVMESALVNTEYNGRWAILNRVFNLASGNYETLAGSAIWDISALEAAFGASSDPSWP